MGESATGTRLGTAQEANCRAAGAALAGLPCVHWDLMPGVRWPSPGSEGDSEIETTKGKNVKTGNKRGKGGQTMEWNQNLKGEERENPEVG